MAGNDFNLLKIVSQMGKITVLLVDDDIDDQEIFLMTLEDIGDDIECNTASNGVEALSILNNMQSEPPQYIFMDVNMHKMNGLECLAKIRQNKSFDRCTIFMYSTTAEEKVIEKSRELRAGFIVKPVYPKELRDKLSAIFRS